MNRRTFVKMAAGGVGAIAAIPPSQAHGKTKAWPEIVSLDNPIGHPFPVKFIEELPLVLHGHAWTNPYEKEAELFRFTAHEWVTEAVLFRGMEIKRKHSSDPSHVDILDWKCDVYIDDYKALEGCRISNFMKDGGSAFPLHDSDPPTCLSQVFRGWADNGGWPDPDHFLGFFLPNKSSLSVRIPNAYRGSISAEIKCDMARYGTKR